MTKEEQRERNFIAFRLSSMLSEAANYAAYFKIPIWAFVNGAEDAYRDTEKYLNYSPDELNDPGVPFTTKPEDPANQGPAEVIRPKEASDVTQPE